MVRNSTGTEHSSCKATKEHRQTTKAKKELEKLHTRTLAQYIYIYVCVCVYVCICVCVCMCVCVYVMM